MGHTVVPKNILVNQALNPNGTAHHTFIYISNLGRLLREV